MWALVLPLAVPVFHVLLVMNFFRQVPRELYESARLDGAGHFRVLFVSFIPLAVPAIATVTLFSIIYHWNSWFDGLIFISNVDKQPLQTYLQSLLVSYERIVSLEDAERLSKVGQRSLMYARLLVAIVPIAIIYRVPAEVLPERNRPWIGKGIVLFKLFSTALSPKNIGVLRTTPSVSASYAPAAFVAGLDGFY